MKPFSYFSAINEALREIFEFYRSEILFYEPVEINGKVIAVRAILKNHKYVKYNNYDKSLMKIIDYIEF